jgi:hypothetical protein
MNDARLYSPLLRASKQRIASEHALGLRLNLETYLLRDLVHRLFSTCGQLP